LEQARATPVAVAPTPIVAPPAAAPAAPVVVPAEVAAPPVLPRLDGLVRHHGRTVTWWMQRRWEGSPGPDHPHAPPGVGIRCHARHCTGGSARERPEAPPATAESFEPE